MKKLLSVAVLTLAVALSFALVGCGGAKDNAVIFQGSWKMTALSGASEDNLAFMEAFGMSVVLDTNDDKSVSLTMMGEEMTGTWEAQSATECTVTIDGSPVTGTLKGEELSLTVEGDAMTFKKISAEEAAQLKENALNLGGDLGGSSSGGGVRRFLHAGERGG